MIQTQQQLTTKMIRNIEKMIQLKVHMNNIMTYIKDQQLDDNSRLNALYQLDYQLKQQQIEFHNAHQGLLQKEQNQKQQAVDNIYKNQDEQTQKKNIDNSLTEILLKNTPLEQDIIKYNQHNNSFFQCNQQNQMNGIYYPNLLHLNNQQQDNECDNDEIYSLKQLLNNLELNQISDFTVSKSAAQILNIKESVITRLEKYFIKQLIKITRQVNKAKLANQQLRAELTESKQRLEKLRSEYPDSHQNIARNQECEQQLEQSFNQVGSELNNDTKKHILNKTMQLGKYNYQFTIDMEIIFNTLNYHSSEESDDQAKDISQNDEQQQQNDLLLSDLAQPQLNQDQQNEEADIENHSSVLKSDTRKQTEQSEQSDERSQEEDQNQVQSSKESQNLTQPQSKAKNKVIQDQKTDTIAQKSKSRDKSIKTPENIPNSSKTHVNDKAINQHVQKDDQNVNDYSNELKIEYKNFISYVQRHFKGFILPSEHNYFKYKSNQNNTEVLKSDNGQNAKQPLKNKKNSMTKENTLNNLSSFKTDILFNIYLKKSNFSPEQNYSIYQFIAFLIQKTDIEVKKYLHLQKQSIQDVSNILRGECTSTYMFITTGQLNQLFDYGDVITMLRRGFTYYEVKRNINNLLQNIPNQILQIYCYQPLFIISDLTHIINKLDLQLEDEVTNLCASQKQDDRIESQQPVQKSKNGELTEGYSIQDMEKSQSSQQEQIESKQNQKYSEVLKEFNKEKQQESVISNLNRDSIYGVAVIDKESSMTVIQRYKLCYLNYINDNDNCQRNIMLSFPKYLITLTLSKVSILNLAKCTNLVNFYSESNKYKQENISTFKKLLRFYSVQDIYKGNISMLRELMQNNHLEYIYVVRGNNIADGGTFSINIKNLKFFAVYAWRNNMSFSLNIQEQFPQNLRILRYYQIQKKEYNKVQVIGSENNVKRLESQLIV